MPPCTHERYGDQWVLAWPDLCLEAHVAVEDQRGAKAEVSFLSTIKGGKIYHRELNLLSARSVSEYAKKLAERATLKTVDAETVMEQLIHIVIEELRTPPAGIMVDDVPAHDEEVYLDDHGMFPVGDVTYLYGKRESAKTLVTMGLAVALHHGITCGPVAPVRPSPRIMWLTWELRARAIGATYRAVKAGLGIDRPSWFRIHEICPCAFNSCVMLEQVDRHESILDV